MTLHEKIKQSFENTECYKHINPTEYLMMISYRRMEDELNRRLGIAVLPPIRDYEISLKYAAKEMAECEEIIKSGVAKDAFLAQSMTLFFFQIDLRQRIKKIETQ